MRLDPARFKPGRKAGHAANRSLGAHPPHLARGVSRVVALLGATGLLISAQIPASTPAAALPEAAPSRLDVGRPWFGFSVVGTECSCDFGRATERVQVHVYFSGTVDPGAAGNLGRLRLALDCGSTDYEATTTFPGACGTSTGPVPQNCPWAPYAPLVISEVGFSAIRPNSGGR